MLVLIVGIILWFLMPAIGPGFFWVGIIAAWFIQTLFEKPELSQIEKRELSRKISKEKRDRQKGNPKP